MAFLKILDHSGNRIPASMLNGAFEGAGTGRRLNIWGMSTSGPNASIFGSLSTLRARSRELIRNNPLASGAIDSFVSNLIGSGISPRWQLDDIELKKQIQEIWADSMEEIDADSLTQVRQNSIKKYGNQRFQPCKYLILLCLILGRRM